MFHWRSLPQHYVAAKFTSAAANADLQGQTCTMQLQQTFCSFKCEKQVHNDKSNIATTKLTPALAATNICCRKRSKFEALATHVSLLKLQICHMCHSCKNETHFIRCKVDSVAVKLPPGFVCLFFPAAKIMCRCKTDASLLL